MAEFFGEITPAVLVVLISGVVQYLKIKWNWKDTDVDILALGLNYVVFVPYTVIHAYLTAPPVAVWEVAWLGFVSLIYPVLAWLMGAGYYYKVLKPQVNKQITRIE